MDIRMYFQKIRQAENGISDEFVVVVSLDTPEGGKSGHMTEVSRQSAARLIVDGKARLATEAEHGTFRQQQQAALEAAEQERLASRIQLTVVPDLAPRHVEPRSEKG